MLVKAILKGINDQHPITTHILTSPPLSNLIKHHNLIAMNDDRLKKIHDDATGLELKTTIAEHEPEVQVELLHSYITAIKNARCRIDKTIRCLIEHVAVCNDEFASTCDKICSGNSTGKHSIYNDVTHLFDRRKTDRVVGDDSDDIQNNGCRRKEERDTATDRRKKNTCSTDAEKNDVTSDVSEVRKLRLYIAKAVVLVFILILLGIGIATFSLTFATSEETNIAMINAFFNTLASIIKFIVSPIN